MEQRLNPRTKRVRDSIMQATRAMVSQRAVDDISLTEIAEAAHVSRPTIYKQFDDVNTLVAETTIDFMERIFADIDMKTAGQVHDDAYLERLLTEFVRTVFDNRAFCKNAMHGPSSVRISNYVVKMLDGRMAQGLVGSRLAFAGEHAADCRISLSAGVVWLLVNWLDSDFQGENAPDAFAKRLVAVLMELSAAFEQ